MTGNSLTPPECDAAREAMSAHLDGETSVLAQSWLTEHLVGCQACRVWHQGALDLRRRTRLTLLPAVPDLADKILASVTDAGDARVSFSGAPASATQVSGRRRLARIGLVIVSLVQLWFSLPVLLFARDSDVSAHPAHELGSFTTALALGYLAVAWRPRFARGMRPLVGIAGALLIATACIDLLRGRTTVGDEAHHLLVVAAYLLMCVIVRFDRGEATPGIQPSRAGAGVRSPTPDQEDLEIPAHDATVDPAAGHGGRASA